MTLCLNFLWRLILILLITQFNSLFMLSLISYFDPGELLNYSLYELIIYVLSGWGEIGSPAFALVNGSVLLGCFLTMVQYLILCLVRAFIDYNNSRN